jgi:hypothetical protein
MNTKRTTTSHIAVYFESSIGAEVPAGGFERPLTFATEREVEAWIARQRRDGSTRPYRPAQQS